MSIFASNKVTEVAFIPVFKRQVITPLIKLLLLSYVMLVATLVIEPRTF